MAMLNELQKDFGFSKSEIAAKCGFSPSLVSAVDDGSRSPRYGLEKLQQLYDSLKKPKPADAHQAPKSALEQQLLDLKEKDPAAYESVKNTIQVLHDRIGLTPNQVAQKAGQRAVEEVKHPGVIYGRRKRKVSSPESAAGSAARHAVDSVTKSSS